MSACRVARLDQKGLSSSRWISKGVIATTLSRTGLIQSARHIRQGNFTGRPVLFRLFHAPQLVLASGRSEIEKPSCQAKFVASPPSWLRTKEWHSECICRFNARKRRMKQREQEWPLAEISLPHLPPRLQSFCARIDVQCRRHGKGSTGRAELSYPTDSYGES